MASNVGIDEDFLQFESKVNQVMKLLEEMSNANKGDSEAAGKSDAKNLQDLAASVNEDNFIVQPTFDRTVINKRSLRNSDEDGSKEMDKFTFMHQMEEDANERARVRKQRENIAQQFRGLGNEAYRKQQFEKAINYYTKAIEHVTDSPILYNNRALNYIKLKNFKRAIIDCDYVLNKLDEKNLRSWLYRAAAYKRLGDENNFESSLKLAKKNNPKQGDYITDFVYKIPQLY